MSGHFKVCQEQKELYNDAGLLPPVEKHDEKKSIPVPFGKNYSNQK